jgi:hypothetical protein
MALSPIQPGRLARAPRARCAGAHTPRAPFPSLARPGAPPRLREEKPPKLRKPTAASRVFGAAKAMGIRQVESVRFPSASASRALGDRRRKGHPDNRG